MSIKTYDPAKVQLIFAGIQIEGYADGTFINAARNNQSWNLTTGADKDAARAKSNDESGTVEITLLQSAASNDALSALSAVDELSGDGVGPLMIKDGSGRTLIAAESAWIQKPADGEFARELSNRVWTLETNSLQLFHGGSTAFGE